MLRRNANLIFLACGLFLLCSPVSVFAHPLHEHEQPSPSGVLRHMRNHHSRANAPARVFFEHLAGASIGLPFYSAGFCRQAGEPGAVGGHTWIRSWNFAAEPVSF